MTYETKTYNTARVVLEGGEYTLNELVAILREMNQLNQYARALIDAEVLASDPQGLRMRRKPTWVGLTDEEVYPLANEHLHYQTEGYEVSGVYNLARAIEAKLKEKNCADH